MKTAIFTDFDGTISRRDVGYTMFHHFSNGKNDELIPDWKAGLITSRECLMREAEMITLSENDLFDYLQCFEIDSGFKNFISHCAKDEIDITIVSDGLDIYINYILNKYQLDYLKVQSNKATITDSQMTIVFPFNNNSCKRCGNCKAERIKEFRDKSEHQYRIIFIGDGYSDACATEEADIIFAKKDLEKFCVKNNIEYIKYDNFFEIAEYLKNINILT